MKIREGEDLIIENPNEWLEVIWFPPSKENTFRRSITWRNKTEILACLKKTKVFLQGIRNFINIQPEKYTGQNYEELISALPKYDLATENTITTLAKELFTDKLKLSRRWIKTFLIALKYNVLVVPLIPVEIYTTEEILEVFSKENLDNKIASYHNLNFQNNLPVIVAYDKMYVDDIIYWLDQNRNEIEKTNNSLNLSETKIRIKYRTIFIGKEIFRIKQKGKIDWEEISGKFQTNFDKLPNAHVATIIDNKLNSEDSRMDVLSTDNMKRCYSAFLREVVKISKKDN